MIKLTHFREGHAIYINPDEIVSFQDGQYQHRDGTNVYFKDKRVFEVRERASEVMQIIVDHQRKRA